MLEIAGPLKLYHTQPPILLMPACLPALPWKVLSSGRRAWARSRIHAIYPSMDEFTLDFNLSE